jgi:hypothetical protein
MSDSMDVLLLNYKLARLTDMIYDIKKCWMPNTNLDKAVPHLEKAVGYLKKELKAYEKKIAYDRRKHK